MQALARKGSAAYGPRQPLLYVPELQLYILLFAHAGDLPTSKHRPPPVRG